LWAKPKPCRSTVQAPVVALLWDAFHRGVPDVGGSTLCAKVHMRGNRIAVQAQPGLGRDDRLWRIKGKLSTDGCS
jgi:hypothetical protein